MILLALAGLATAAKPLDHCTLGLDAQPLASIEGQPVEAATPLGTVRGRHLADSDVDAFIGIPYARVTKRFAPAEPVEAWEAPLDATTYGPACLQPNYRKYASDLARQAEDCLSLNVWTPAADEGARPVIVWIHGGGWLTGSNLDPLYHQDRLAARGDVVVVGVNYRLGPFGFSHVPGMPGSGNLGLVDQRDALRWVQANIAAFGGDPANVTVLGQSAGGMATLLQVVEHADEGLFVRAVAGSGGLDKVRVPEFAEAVTAQLAERAGGDLTAAPACEVLNAVVDLSGDVADSGLLFGPVDDGVVVHGTPLSRIAAGERADVPLLLGFTKDEASYFTDPVGALSWFPTKWALGFLPAVSRALGDDRNAAVRVFRKDLKVRPVRARTSMMISDATFRFPVLAVADAQSAHAPVWVYRFDQPVPGRGGKLGATHGSDLGAISDHEEGWEELYGPDGLPDTVVHALQDAIIAFARTGSPQHDGLPDWPRYDTARRPILSISPTPTVLEDPYAGHRPAWAGIPFDGSKLHAVPGDAE